MLTETFIADVLHIRDAALADRLASIAERLHLSKGELLIREGEPQTRFVFLVEGILRGYFLDIGGRDITDCFTYQCGAPAVSCFSIGTSSAISVEALTSCELLSLPNDALTALMEEYPRLLWDYNCMLQQALRTHWEIRTMLCQHTAMERYQWFLQTYPALADRVSNKYIASFLGMTPVTLSRLRRALREQAAPGRTQQGGGQP